MDVTIYILIALVAVGVVIFFFMRRTKALPGGAEPEPKEPKPERLPEAAAAPKSAGEEKALPEKAAPAEEGSPDKPPVAPEVGQAPAAPAPGEAEPGADELDVALEAPAAEARKPSPEAARDAEAEKARAEREEELKALSKGLATTRGGFISRLAKLFSGKKEIDEQLLTEIEEILITADLGVKTTENILQALKKRMESGELPDEATVWAALRSRAREILTPSAGEMKLNERPTVILVVGVNGVGKTTTIGKLASRFEKHGKKVLLAAADTFRAAAVLQLEVWGRRVGCPVVKGKENADPGSVVFDAIKKASQEGIDIVIADTAGRLHTKIPLMEELKKLSRTAAKALDGRPADEILLVLDSTIGQNAVQQARMFREALDISGFVLTKLDGTAKGGVILAIVDEHQIPVRYIGLGEKVEDLREFDADNFVAALFAKPDEKTLAA
jgi:fused signal recognition particle receptor